MRRYVSAIVVLSVAFGAGCSDSIGAPDFEESFGQPAFATLTTDDPATVTPVTGGFVLRKELSGVNNYGVADGKSDILYSLEDDQWNFDMSVISDKIVSATAVISLVLDDHYGRAETEYVGAITLNGREVFSGGFSSLGVTHGRPHDAVFDNWKIVSFSFSHLAPSTYTVAIDNNTTGAPMKNWIGIDFIEIHVETMPTICHIPPENPSNAHTITVPVNAVAAHLAHGDFAGPCE